MEIIKSAVRNDKEYVSLLKDFRREISSADRLPIYASGFSEGNLETFIAALTGDSGNMKAVIVMGDEKSALSLQSRLLTFFTNVLYYPKKDFVFMSAERERTGNPFEYIRLGTLKKILEEDYDVIITTAEAMLQYTIPPETLERNTIKLTLGGNLNKQAKTSKLSEFFDLLITLGYDRADVVEGTAKFSVRGGIVDIFVPSMDFPVRLELFGDEIDSMGLFDPLSQRRTENIKEFEIVPASECILDAAARERCITALEKLMKNKNTADEVKSRLGFEYDLLSAGENINSKDRFISHIYGEKKTLTDYFDKNAAALFILESSAVRESLSAAEFINNETTLDLISNGYIDGRNSVFSANSEDFELLKNEFPTVIADTFAAGAGGSLAGLFSFTAKQSPKITDGFGVITDDIMNYTESGYRILIMLDTDSGIKSFTDTLGDLEIKYTVMDISRRSDINELPQGIVTVMKTPKRAFGATQILCGVSGFELPKQQFVLITDSMSDRERSIERVRKSGSGKKEKSGRQKIMSYTDLAPGDYVVHKSHGIGIFAGVERLDVSGGVQKDFIKIKYSGADVLFVPCNQLDMVSKFIGAGSEEGTVRLSKMGTVAWQKTKAKAKAAAKSIAGELIKLYAARMAKKGYAFSSDTEWQRDFESLFEYAETDDQLICASQIKEDMQRSVPMDRLLCGDVGFGKTEVALRAVFKCVSESKQAAILVPTTILAWQHYRTIISRFREFPVKVELLSRFKTKKEQEETIRKLKIGEVDIVIGTHRIIQKDIKFKDLGLLVVDEEQRFGVAHKEKLKQLAQNIDVLTLTATPIPRTLNMALSGIRDMSVIEEPPHNRIPVQTFVFEYDEVIVAEAIKTELRRGGQVFYLYNRVETIESKAARVRELSGGARVGVAHGQMEEETLSRVWREMVDGEIDILVCTTIIESGIDVPDANTLIVENADRLGLSQLHQIRGRVGRSNRRAYAYLSYPKYKTLSEIAEKRLKAVRENTEFGAGFKIAMRDLEIRGAGNILGAEQHGQMDAVGYDLYIKILERAVSEEKKRFDKKLALGYSARIDDAVEEYFPDGEEGEAEKDKTPTEKPKKYGTKIFKKDELPEPEPTEEDELTEPEPTECLVDIAVDAFIPNRYIESDILRIEIYKRIAAIESRDDAEDLADELNDRFGEIPRPVANLIDIALIRNIACEQFIETVENKDKKSIILFLPVFAKSYGRPVLEKWTRAAGKLSGRLLISMGVRPHVTYFLRTGENIIDAMKLIFSALPQ